MQSVILNSKSKTDLKLIIDLANKIGIQSRVLSESEIEEIGLAHSIRIGRTNKFINTSDFIEKLRK